MASDQASEVFPILTLPDTVFEQMLGFLSFHEIAMLRRVSVKFNNTCKRLLNQGFRAAEKFHGKCLKDVKTKLPRRESERRNHKLSRHCDILTAIETRISLLSMTFIKFVDVNLCCFIPGKVIDEIFSVLRTITKDENPPRAFEILQELRDISSMAMEYFDDKIVSNFKVLSPLKYSPSFSALHMNSNYPVVLPVVHGHSPALSLSLSRFQDCSPPRTPSTSKRLVEYPLSEPSKPNRKLFSSNERLSKTCKKLKKSGVISKLKKQAEMYKNTVEVQNTKIVDMDKKIDQQNEIIQQQNAKIAEQAEKIAEIHRRFVESGVFPPLLKDSKKTKGKADTAVSEQKLSRKRSCEDKVENCEGVKRVKVD